jgi:Rrf2 family protein
MLAMTKKTGYGLVALTYLASLSKDKLASAREIAENFEMPQALVMNILKELSAAGVVESVRGARGGYRLVRGPEEINFVSLMEILEGPMKLAECIRESDPSGGGNHPRTCKIMHKCPIADPVHRIHRKIHDYLAQMTLADILHESPQTAAVAVTSAER